MPTDCTDCRWHSLLHVSDFCDWNDSYIADPTCARWCWRFEPAPEFSPDAPGEEAAWRATR